MRMLIQAVLNNIKNKSVIIVGAGKRGKELLTHIEKDSSIHVVAFFDNNEKLIGSKIKHIDVMKPFMNSMNDGCVYVVAVDSVECRNNLVMQLKILGIDSNNIIVYCHNRDYDYLSHLDEKNYQNELQEMYYERFDRYINWENPVTYNEKINWEKLNVKDTRRTRLADKYLVRNWVQEKIGVEHLTKLYGVWDDDTEIDFDILPNAFVLKMNNGSGRNIIVKDKSKINQKDICNQLNEWKKKNYVYTLFEMQYKDIVPKIICEEYLDGVAESVYDYNIYCFHGEPVYIWCIKGSHRPECKASFYNRNWEMQPFSYGYPKDPIVAPRPEKLDEMLELSKILCKDFVHVRVDWYNLPDGRVLFGEMTFSTWGGMSRFEPDKYDTVFGNLI